MTGIWNARLAAWPPSKEPSSGIGISKAKAVMLDTPGMLIRMKGDGIGEAFVGFDNLEDCGFDGRDLSCLIAEISLRPCQSGAWRDQLIERPRRAA